MGMHPDGNASMLLFTDFSMPNKRVGPAGMNWHYSVYFCGGDFENIS